MKVLVVALVLLLSGCASMGGTRRTVDNSCAFAYFLSTPSALIAVAACTFGADAVLGDQRDEIEIEELSDV